MAVDRGAGSSVQGDRGGEEEERPAGQASG